MNTISVFLTILLVIAFFGVMIFLHELGHYTVARLFKVKILEFAIGMGPKLVSRVSKKTGTRYSLRALPIGGFCSLLGENDSPELGDDEGALCHKPARQRFLVLFAGAFMNLLSAFLVMLLILVCRGTYLSNEVQGFYVPSYSAGLEIGDEILAVGDTPVESEDDISAAVRSLGNALCTLTVERDGEEITIGNIALPQAEEDGTFYRVPDFLVGEGDARPCEVTHYHAASASAGLNSGDVIRAVNGKKTPVYSDITWEIGLAGDSPVTLTLDRGGEEVTLQDIVFPVTSQDGIILGSPDFGLAAKPIEGVFPTLGRAFSECVSTAKVIYRSLIELIAGRFGTAGLSGPIGVGKVVEEAASYGILTLLELFVMISINLGICNLLPLPALDGGRLIFVILEMIRRKPVNQKYETMIHTVGMVLLLILTALIAAQDIFKLIGG